MSTTLNQAQLFSNSEENDIQNNNHFYVVRVLVYVVHSILQKYQEDNEIDSKTIASHIFSPEHNKYSQFATKFSKVDYLKGDNVEKEHSVYSYWNLLKKYFELNPTTNVAKNYIKTFVKHVIHQHNADPKYIDYWRKVTYYTMRVFNKHYSKCRKSLQRMNIQINDLKQKLTKLKQNKDDLKVHLANVALFKDIDQNFDECVQKFLDDIEGESKIELHTQNASEETFEKAQITQLLVETRTLLKNMVHATESSELHDTDGKKEHLGKIRKCLEENLNLSKAMYVAKSQQDRSTTLELMRLHEIKVHALNNFLISDQNEFIKELYEENAELETSKESLNLALEQLETEIKEKEQQLQNLQAEHENVSTNQEECRSCLQELERIKSQNNALQRERNEAEAEINRHSTLLSDCQTKHSKLESKLSEQAKKINELEQFIKETERTCNNKISEYRNTISNLKERNRNLKVQVNTNDNNSELQTVIEEQEQYQKKLIEAGSIVEIQRNEYKRENDRLMDQLNTLWDRAKAILFSDKSDLEKLISISEEFLSHNDNDRFLNIVQESKRESFTFRQNVINVLNKETSDTATVQEIVSLFNEGEIDKHSWGSRLI